MRDLNEPQDSPSSTVLTTPSTSRDYQQQQQPQQYPKSAREKFHDHTTEDGGLGRRRMEHPDSGQQSSDSHRKRSAAQRALAQQQQQQQQQQSQQQQPSQQPPSQEQLQQQDLATTGRRRVAHERYLAAVAASSTSSQQQQAPPHQQQPPIPIPGGAFPPQRPQAGAVSGAIGVPPPQQQVLPPSYAGVTGPQHSNMPTGVAAVYAPAAAAAVDPYQRQQQLLYQQAQQQQQQQQAHAQQQQQVLPASQQYPAVSAGYPYYGQASQQAPPPPPQQAPPPPQQVVAAAVGGPSYVGPSGSEAVVSAQTQAAALQVSQPSGRLPSERPLIKLSTSLIDTYKHINTIYYEEREARRKANQKDGKNKQAGAGPNNNGWDDDNYDYIITPNEVILNRYKIKERIGKGSFGQVVRAEDLETKKEVAIKIIKSKKPFLMQAKTEIELLTHLWEKDPEDQHNVVRLLTHFVYRNHQCLVFEMLSLNLYELLKNTQFGGVSLNLIRKFAKQVLRALAFLARPDVDVIHCDLKPENILLRHPKKSGVKVIDFGSSCRSNKRMYSYIQSRFYRSPEVMLGLPYSVAIDMWSLGCILVEMHTGEPLFSGSDQFDQMQKIVKILGMIPSEMLDKSTDQVRNQFFDRKRGQREWTLRQTKPETKSSKSQQQQQEQQSQPQEFIAPSTDPIASLTEVITTGAQQKKKYPPSEAHNSQRNYELFVDLVFKMLAYNPEERIKPLEALEHDFLSMPDTSQFTPAMAASRH